VRKFSSIISEGNHLFAALRSAPDEAPAIQLIFDRSPPVQFISVIYD